MILTGTDARTLIFDEQGQLREGVVVVKTVRGCGPYGYQVTYIRGTKDSHTWEYLGLAEPGLAVGTYSPDAPLKFYRGHARDLEDKRLILVGKWDTYRTSAELDIRLENAGYLKEVVT